MLKKSLAEIPSQPMTMPGATNVTMQMLAGPADGCPNFAMRKFTVAPGGSTPRHFHNYEHEILVLAGQGTAFATNADHPIKAGDVLYIPANEPHQFTNTGNSNLEFLCMVPAVVHTPNSPAATLVDCSK
jgi:quercetin dioxygenase-like cupin family protein